MSWTALSVGLTQFSGPSRAALIYAERSDDCIREHHPDMCSIGPTERWLEHAVFLLSNDLAYEEAFYTGSSGYVLRGYAAHAVRDYVLDEVNRMLGWDIKIRVLPMLDAILAISKMPEEGYWPRGDLSVVAPQDFSGLPCKTLRRSRS